MSRQGISDDDATGSVAWDAGALVVVLVGAITAFGLTLGHDVAWCLHAAGLVADGARLYRDLIEVNPPLIIWLSLPPVLLARGLGGSEIVFFQGYLFALVLLSLWLCRRLIASAFAAWPPRMRGLLLMLLALLFVPWEDYGQREHLMVLLTMPYLLSATARSLGRETGKGMGVVIGVMAGIGLAIKPYFLLLWIVVELYLRRRDGRRSMRRPESLAIIAVLLCYAIAVVTLTPGYFAVVSLALDAYGAYNCRFTTLFNRPGVAVCAVALVVTALVRPLPADRAARRVFLLAAASLLAAAIIQHKGWGYHYYPADVTARIAIFLSLWIVVERLPDADRLLRRGRSGLALTVALGIVVAAGFELRTMTKSPIAGMDLLPVVKSRAAGRYVACLSTSVVYPFPVVNYAGARWGLRFPSLWLLPAAYKGVAAPPGGSFPYHPRAEMGEPERYTVDAVVEDLRDHPPAIILVDRHADQQGMGGNGFDYLAYFGRDPRFAEIIAGYDSLGMVDSMVVMGRWKRNEPPRHEDTKKRGGGPVPATDH